MSSAPRLERVGVIIVNYRSLPELMVCAAQPALRGVGQVVVVDNASDPAGVRSLCEARAWTAVLRSDNGGFAVGVNAGVAALRTDIDVVWLLNPDITIEERLPAALVSRLDEGWDAVAPNLVQPDGRGQVGAAGGRLSVGSFLAYFLFLSRLLPAWQGIS